MPIAFFPVLQSDIFLGWDDIQSLYPWAGFLIISCLSRCTNIISSCNDYRWLSLTKYLSNALSDNARKLFFFIVVQIFTSWNSGMVELLLLTQSYEVFVWPSLSGQCFEAFLFPSFKYLLLGIAALAQHYAV